MTSMPALLTSTRTGPRSRSISAIAAATLALSDTSISKAPLGPSRSATASFAAARFRSQAATGCPARDRWATIARPMPPPAPVTRATGRSAATSVRPCIGDEARLALLQVRGQAFAHLGATEADELQPQRGLEGRDRAAVPVVEAVLGPPDRGRRTLGQLDRDALGLGHDIVVLDTFRHQADALGLLAGQRV